MVIKCSAATKRFGDLTAVDGADFEVTRGEVVGFVGANGAGKSTTIGMLLGFIAPTEGTVQIFGDEVRPASAHRQHARIGYAAGDMQLPSTLTARQYLGFLSLGGTYPVISFWDSWASPGNGVMEQELPSVDATTGGEYCIEAVHESLPDKVYHLNRDDRQPTAGHCAI